MFGVPGRLLAAFADSADYPWKDTILTAGITMSMPPPPWYLPLWFGGQTPIVVLVLAIAGILSPIALLVPRLRREGADADVALGTGQALVSAQALLLPLGAVVTSAVLYDGTRQVLFVLPAFAVSATVATWLVARRLAARGRPGLRMALVWALGVSLVVPTVTGARLFPYSYSWFNGIAAAFPVDGAWMTDYWSASNREAIPLLPAGDEESCHEWTPGTRLLPCESFAEQAVFWPTRGTGVQGEPLGPGEYVQLSFNRGSVEPPAGCRQVDAVDRRLFARGITMSLVMRCASPCSRIRSRGSTRGRTGTTTSCGDGSQRPAGCCVGDTACTPTSASRCPPRRRRGRRPGAGRRSGARPGHVATTLEVLVNGTPVGRFSFADDTMRTLEVRVPPAVLGSVGDGRVVVRLAVPPGSAASADDATTGAGARTFRVGRVTVERAS